MGTLTLAADGATIVEEAELARYADLLVRLGANVQPGQIVEVRATPEQAALARALAGCAYRCGARFVDVRFFDGHVRRARILYADPDTLDFVPSWSRDRVHELGEQRCARITLVPQLDPALYADLDPALTAREPFPSLREYFQVVTERTTNWTAGAYPTASWAATVHPQLAPEDALGRLWEQLRYACRLDEADPIAAWERRIAALGDMSSRLQARRFDALEFHGRGTELTVGLLPGSRWLSGTGETVDGIRHAPNLPTEETFTAPDPERTEGVVTASRALVLKTGVCVDGLVVRFEAGRAVSVEARSGLEALREDLSSDDGACRLGEVALVDREGRVGSLDTVFFETLLDENAASHLALGAAYVDSVDEEDRPRVNRSGIHIDFMLGGDDVDVLGVTQDGERVPVLRGGVWQL